MSQDKDTPREALARLQFEADAAPMGFDLTRQSIAVPEPWAEYADESTGHRWGGWLAAFDRAAIADVPAVPTDLHAAIMNLPCIPNNTQNWTRYGSARDHLLQAYADGHRDARHAAAELAAAPQSSALPEGWKLAPVTPTQEMLRAATAYSARTALPHGKGYYAEMIAASPQEPTNE
jgi:hypothetical protein